MSLSALALAVEYDGHEARLWKMLAYVARYGATPPSVSRRMPMTELKRFAESLGQLLAEEAESTRRPVD